MSLPAGVKNLWDEGTQEAHGGQTWSLLGDKFVADFSVTTNGLGIPKPALQAAHDALSLIDHYPAADNAAPIRGLVRYTGLPEKYHLVGNGASEFIDLAMRLGPPGPFKTGPYMAAYKEYDRAAKVAGREVVPWGQTDVKPGVIVIIHPNSPTGDWMPLDELDAVCQKAKDDGTLVLVDESFISFIGPEWQKDSAMSLVDKYPENLVVIVSWTKLWACPGIRLGSVIVGENWYNKFKKNQTPWSCNIPAQLFLESACNDDDYMEQTWSTIPAWRKNHESLIKELGWSINEQSPAWVPWIFVDCGSEEVAARAATSAHNAGCPVRWCKSFGCPAHLRLGIRHPDHQAVLHEAWKKEFSA